MSAKLMGVSFWAFTRESIIYGEMYNQLSLLLFPLAGYTIFSVEKWSYRAYLVTMLCITANNFYWWHHFPIPLGLAWTIFIQVINILTVSYFLNPKIRTIYYTDAIKWWKSKPRYPLSAFCQIDRAPDITAHAQTTDISEGGLFLNHSLNFSSGEEIFLRIIHEDRIHPLKARVIFSSKRLEESGSGIKFLHTPQSRKAIKALIRKLKASGVTQKFFHSRLDDFRAWFRELVNTGKGLVPEIPQKPQPAPDNKQNYSHNKSA